jgi:predicted RNA-binding Zn-ribbon protein involved in translation (DUF1610 family)
MIYCYHCGYELNDEKLEKKKSTRQTYREIAPSSADIQYVCPRCGRLIHRGHSEEEKKSLSRSCHAELQRGRNDLARGMSSLVLFLIAGITSFVFLLLSNKTTGSGKAISTSCAEFWVFLGLAIVSVVLVVLGVYHTLLGLKRKRIYTAVLKDINNDTFVQ